MVSGNEFSIHMYGPAPKEGEAWRVDVIADSPRTIGSPDEPINVIVHKDLPELRDKFFEGSILWGDCVRLGRMLGQIAFPGAFSGEIVDAALDQFEPLRIALRFNQDEPHLIYLPWELLRSDVLLDENTDSEAGFLALQPGISISRQLSKVRTAKFNSRRTRLALTAFAGEPVGRKRLNLKNEAAAVKQHAKNAAIALMQYETAKYGEISGALRNKKAQFDFFHFSGHGEIGGSHEGGGAVMLMDGPGIQSTLTAQEMAGLCLGSNVPLVVLNACETAAGSLDPVQGPAIATALFASGVHSVVGMQREITERAGTAFTKAFYEAITGRLSVDDATVAGRLAIKDAARNNLHRLQAQIEAFAPVLFRYHERALYSQIDLKPSYNYCEQVATKKEEDSKPIKPALVRVAGTLVCASMLLMAGIQQPAGSLAQQILTAAGWITIVTGGAMTACWYFFLQARSQAFEKAIPALEPIERELKRLATGESAGEGSAHQWLEQKIKYQDQVSSIVEWVDAQELAKRALLPLNKSTVN